MTSNYKKIGNYIRLVDVRNRNLDVHNLLGLSIDKVFIPSVANTIGTNMANYKIIKKGQFACSLMQVRRDKKIPVALQKDFDEAIISQAYPVFEVIDPKLLDPEYLMMWMSRSEFDRQSCFHAVGGVRGSLEWNDFCDMTLPIPSIEKQREIVREYNVVNDRIALNEKLTQKLEETAQAIYKQWFVDFEFPISKEYADSIGKPELEGKPYKSSGGGMGYSKQLEKDIPKMWEAIPIQSFTKQMQSGGTPQRDNKEYWNSNDVPWIKTGEVANCVIIKSEEYISQRGLSESSAKIYPVDTVLIAMYGDGKTKGQVGYLRIESASNQACCAMQCNNPYDASFLFYYLRFNYRNIIRSAIGGAQENLSKKLIQNLCILNVEKKLINKLPFLNFIDCSEIYAKENVHLESLRSTILQKISQN